MGSKETSPASSLPEGGESLVMSQYGLKNLQTVTVSLKNTSSAQCIRAENAQYKLLYYRLSTQ